MDWTKCIVCQIHLRSEKLSCPCDRKHFDPKVAYQTFLDNVKTLKEINALPKPVSLPEGTTAKDLEEKRGLWHQSCYRAFKADKVKKEKRKSEEKMQSETRHSKRLKSAMDYKLCVFCEKTVLSDFTLIVLKMQRKIYVIWLWKWVMMISLQRYRVAILLLSN